MNAPRRARPADDDDLLPSLRINPASLDYEYQRTPADLAYANEQYAVAVREKLRAEFALEHIEAQLVQRERDALPIGSKTTVTELKARMLTAPEYVKARERLIDTEYEVRSVRGRVEALEAKIRMLQMIGGKLRTELEREPSVRRTPREWGDG